MLCKKSIYKKHLVLINFFYRNKICKPNIEDEKAEENVSEDQEKIKEWLKHNHEPWDTIKMNWKKTCAIRKIDLESKKINFDDLLKNWPRYSKLTGFELMEIDFENKYPNAVNNLKYLWPGYISRVIQLAFDEAKSAHDRYGMEKFDMQNESQDDDNNFNGFIALNAIFYMLPKSNKTSKQNLHRLLRPAPKGTLISSEIQRISQELADIKKRK